MCFSPKPFPFAKIAGEIITFFLLVMIENVGDPRVDERLNRIEDHRLVIDRQQMFIGIQLRANSRS